MGSMVISDGEKSNQILKEFGFAIAIRMVESERSDKIMGKRDRKMKKGDKNSYQSLNPPI